MSRRRRRRRHRRPCLPGGPCGRGSDRPGGGPRARWAAGSRTRATSLRRRRLAAQLARTEEAAKRALVKGDSSARGGVAQRLLDAERQLQAAREEVADLNSKLAT